MLEARHLIKKYKKLTAVNDVTLKIAAGRTRGLVGESGCGKSTLARLFLLLEKPDAGEITFEGRSITGWTSQETKRFRRSVQIVFQDPLASLNPRMKVKDILEEPFLVHPEVSEGSSITQVKKLIDVVGLRASMKDRFSHELSGGERQRVCIARAVALKPKVLICDEAVSSLDVLVQAQVLNLMLRLQKEFHLAYLFISHDLRVVRHMSDDLSVMKEGRIIEEGPSERIYDQPHEAYTKQLLNSMILKR
jgi:ABC-type glutathione transport system ATPase component